MGGKRGQDKRRQAAKRRKREKRAATVKATRIAQGTPLVDVVAWPVAECWISEGWDSETRGLVQVLVARSSRGRWATAAFLVDLDCLGVKDVLVARSQTAREHRNLRRGVFRVAPGHPCEAGLAAKVVFAGVAYAESLGIPPHPGYREAARLLAGLSPESCHLPVPLGRDGLPFFVAGPNDDAEAIVAHLSTHLGTDGFHFLAPTEG